ncbi:MAG TPA: carbohydrate-binding protein [Ohtaekwangia sp.]|nr:carbohydrate-binding protein [Ohtaekwangia sp.]
MLKLYKLPDMSHAVQTLKMLLSFLLCHGQRLIKSQMPAAIMLLASFQGFAQYLHTDAKKIVDGQGNEVILRGMGLGGWMLQEGYMLETNAFANPQHEIRARIVDLIGESNTNTFYDAWLANHVTRRDIDSLASWGFNSVRLPMHYNLYTLPIEQEPVPGQHTWLEKGFAMTDSLLKWCAANHLYVILDLHAAPGGQGRDAAISDYDSSKPSLWESPANQQKTIALWKKLAERYADEVWIGGYDLINETNWNFTAGANQNGCSETTNAPLRKLYVDITTAIREVDQNHIIFIEGNCWANNHNGLMPAWDTNMVLSFHKYWNNNDQGSLQGVINMRNQHNLPLWMGEGGENSNTWSTNAIRLLEENHIGWAWWPLKKVGGINSPFSVIRNDGYAALLNYWQNGGAKPDVAFAKNALMKLTEDLKVENVVYRKDVTDAMFRQVYDASTRPFTKHVIPGVVHVSNFDLGRNNQAYADKDTANYNVTTGNYTAWNAGWIYRNDGVDLEVTSDTHANANGYNIGWTNDGEWVQYTVGVDSGAAYNVTIRYSASGNAAKIRLSNGSNSISPVIALPSTGGFQTWKDHVISDVVLPKGPQRLRLHFEKGGANVSFLQFTLSKKTSEVPFKGLLAETDDTGSRITLSLNKKGNAATLNGIEGFSLSVNGSAGILTGVQMDNSDPSKFVFTTDAPLSDTDVLTLSYNGNHITATDATPLETFSNLPIRNNLPLHLTIPGKIEAEAFTVNQGLQLENTSDTGGGQNIGFTNAGDYLEYLVRVPADGEYPLEVRVACNNQAGKIEVQQLTKGGQLLHYVMVDIPVTGGWQTWQTVRTRMTLKAGSGILKVKIIQPEFNINWFRFAAADVISGSEKDRQGLLQLYPNPTDGDLFIDLPENAYSSINTLTVTSINGSLMSRQDSVSREAIRRINVGWLPAGLYILELDMNGKVWRNKFLFQREAH